ncbi:dienelactone hydrolase family protein [Halobacteriaceae archaeon GCM10025711]
MTDGRLSRRQVLTTAGAGALAGLAGCVGSEEDPTTTRTTERTTDSTTKTTTETATAEPTTAAQSTETTTGDGPRTVTFESTTGAAVTGTLYPGGSCAVVLVPQINLDRESWRPYAERLAEAGYTALAIDEREDERAASVVGAVQYLNGRDAGSVVLVGASSGGEAVVRANARADRGSVDGTVTLSAAGGASVAPDLQGRLLFVVSEGDDDRFVETARALHENAPDPKRLVTYDGDAHGQRLFETGHATDLASKVVGLLSAACESA